MRNTKKTKKRIFRDESAFENIGMVLDKLGEGQRSKPITDMDVIRRFMVKITECKKSGITYGEIWKTLHDNKFIVSSQKTFVSYIQRIRVEMGLTKKRMVIPSEMQVDAGMAKILARVARSDAAQNNQQEEKENASENS